MSIGLLLVLVGCRSKERAIASALPDQARPEREGAIPSDAPKITPDLDHHPPVLHSLEFLDPVPLPGPVNTAGAEDSPFISPDGQMLFFFFTPDVDVPPEKQLLDGVTGIYLTRWTEDSWGEPVRVFLQEDGKLALDGCGFFDGAALWFCSAREGYTGIHWFKADRVNGNWAAPTRVEFDDAYEVGELHIHDGELYFHSQRPGGKGAMDLWVSREEAGVWQPPENLAAVNTEYAEGYPFITVDGQELWFTRWHQGTPAIFRSVREDEGWGEPELIISQFAGEPTLDPQGNVYFVHHFYQDGEMIEADIYVAKRK
ncbi:MAG: hypothetical protein P1P76_06760 [Anaerolineales bacterium]|nr:hypothetical protein [Anaerolineales bacterium]